MSSNQGPSTSSVSPPPATQGRRRSSIAELFSARPNLDSSPPGPGFSRASGSSMATALSQAQDQSKTRRLSITTLGLSGTQPSVPQTNPFGNLRRGSSTYDTTRRKSIDSDSAIDDSDTVPPMSASVGSDTPARPNGASPMGRRLSFGARAYGDVRASFSGSSMGLSPGNSGSPSSNSGSDSAGVSSTGSSPSNKPSSPAMKGKADGFSWTETLRSRAQRTSVSTEPHGGSLSFPALHNRSKSAAAHQSAPAPVAAPKPPPKAPDHFQERILKGDFYMD